MPVTWSFSSARSRAELTFVDPYTIFEWHEAMLGLLAMPELPSSFTMLVDRRGAASPGSGLKMVMFDLIIRHKLDQRQVRVAELISLPDLPPTKIAWGLTHHAIGTLRSRTFHDRELAERWLNTGDD